MGVEEEEEQEEEEEEEGRVQEGGAGAGTAGAAVDIVVIGAAAPWRMVVPVGMAELAADATSGVVGGGEGGRPVLRQHCFQGPSKSGSCIRMQSRAAASGAASAIR